MHTALQLGIWCCRIEHHRQDLAPQVSRWKAFEARASVFQTRKVQFLQQQADHLATAIEEKDKQVMSLLSIL